MKREEKSLRQVVWEDIRLCRASIRMNVQNKSRPAGMQRIPGRRFGPSPKVRDRE